jgi:hypothetical protein
LLTGALTVLNEDGLLIEMNVSHGDKVTQPQGMPALFFNRYCAENASSVADIEKIIAIVKPLGPYHLTASDGENTQSFHFYQHTQMPGAHAVESLNKEKSSPQFFVVPNYGITYKEGKSELDTHSDSDRREQNIQAFLRQPTLQTELAGYIARQQEEKGLDANDMLALKELCVQIARLAIVNNCESVLCALYVYHRGHLDEALAATDNLYAPKKALSEFKQLSLPYVQAPFFQREEAKPEVPPANADTLKTSLLM